jgi:hypothetical protein
VGQNSTRKIAHDEKAYGVALVYTALKKVYLIWKGSFIGLLEFLRVAQQLRSLAVRASLVSKAI